MGMLGYDAMSFEFEDRLLSHLKIVIAQKLRRRESFLLSWAYSADAGSGRSSIWLTEASMLHFRFHGSKPPALNREWLNRMMTATYNVNGLILNEVPEEDPQAPREH